MAMMAHVNVPRLRCKGPIVFLRCTNSIQDHQNQIRDQHDCSHARYREQQSLRRLVMTGKPLDLHNHCPDLVARVTAAQLG
jgi:hypothetical protein